MCPGCYDNPVAFFNGCGHGLCSECWKDFYVYVTRAKPEPAELWLRCGTGIDLHYEFRPVPYGQDPSGCFNVPSFRWNCPADAEGRCNANVDFRLLCEALPQLPPITQFQQLVPCPNQSVPLQIQFGFYRQIFKRSRFSNYCNFEQVLHGSAREHARQLIHQLYASPQVDFLDLSANKLGYEIIVELAAPISGLPNLRVLVLDDNRIGAEGCAALAQQFVHLSALQMLCLSGNNLDAACIRHLSPGLFYLSSLQELRLNCNNIDDAAMNSLASSLQRLNVLQILDLVSCFVARMAVCCG